MAWSVKLPPLSITQQNNLSLLFWRTIEAPQILKELFYIHKKLINRLIFTLFKQMMRGK